MKGHKWPDAPLERKVIGKIIDPEGKPVAGAVLNVDGYKNGQYSSYGGVNGKAETYSATDENGEFLITCSNGVMSVNATIEARGLAKRKIWLDAGKAHLLRMKHGVEVSGRLLKDGNPISGVNVSMTMQEREAGVSMRGFDGTTGADGRFTIPNVPANMHYYLSTKIKDTAKLGVALSPQLISTGGDESVSKVGDLTLRPAYTMRGKVVVADGQPLPSEHALVSRTGKRLGWTADHRERRWHLRIQRGASGLGESLVASEGVSDLGQKSEQRLAERRDDRWPLGGGFGEFPHSPGEGRTFRTGFRPA